MTCHAACLYNTCYVMTRWVVMRRVMCVVSRQANVDANADADGNANTNANANATYAEADANANAKA